MYGTLPAGGYPTQLFDLKRLLLSHKKLAYEDNRLAIE